MADDICRVRSLPIEVCIKEALDWHRDLCQRVELEKRIEIRRSRCIHNWKVLNAGENDSYVYQCEFCGEIDVGGDE
jgi:hypothetical protein